MQIIDWLRSHSLSVTEFLRQCMYVALAFEMLNWNDQQQAVVLAAISGFFSLMVSKQTVSARNVDAIVDKRVDREVAIRTGTGDGSLPPAA